MTGPRVAPIGMILESNRNARPAARAAPPNCWPFERLLRPSFPLDPETAWSG
ncbi:MAG: hypothetical protein IID49_00010 [Proteobacteria bacterium]|nr:hypothetical protein [Pseudomonadota bacterium]MCH8950501.1 hypothetical protein [Pseudomonadota bacterium]